METFPLFFGGLFAILITLNGLFRLALPRKGHPRMNGLLLIGIGVIGWVPLLMVLPSPFDTLQSVSGTYVGEDNIGPAIYHLYPNGTFDRTSPEKDPLSFKGKWEIEEESIYFTYMRRGHKSERR